MVIADGYSYVYDGNNKRVKQMDSHGTSYSFYGSNGRLLFRQESGVPVDYYYLGAKLVAKKKGSTVTYLHTDYLGSPTAESDASGAVTAHQHYQPFGASIELPIDDIGYTGHKFDTDIGLSYMEARYYDPVLARFMANDPVGFSPASPATFNRYLYANNNPYRFTDPDGRFAFLIPMAVGAFVGAITNTVVQFARADGSFTERLSQIDLNQVAVAAGAGALGCRCRDYSCNRDDNSGDHWGERCGRRSYRRWCCTCKRRTRW